MHRPATSKTSSDHPVAATEGPRAAFLQQRLHSLDAYRGLIMIALAFNGFGLAAVAKNQLDIDKESVFWQEVRHQFNHVEWVGGGFWDMIQPSFMFMVGVSLPYSYAVRRARGQTYGRMAAQALWRSAVLVFLGIFLISNGFLNSTGVLATNWSLVNVLTQIGLGYVFLFLLWDRPLWVQVGAAVAILAGTWLMYVFYPGAGVGLEKGAPQVGVPAAWAADNLTGVAAAWHKNANVGHAIDLWLLNLLPVADPFKFNNGGYQTINFIPSLATMLFGLMSGELLRSDRAAPRKWLILVLAGLAALAVGLGLDYFGVCPLVKRIWTPSWAIYSTGWCLLMLAGLYGAIDLLGFRSWAFPLVVVGVNSIAMYCMGQLLKSWTAKTLQTHLGPGVFSFFGDRNELLVPYEPLVQATLVGFCFWLVCLWMYRQKIFVRI